MFDNLSKFLAQQYPQDFASWLVGKPIKLTELKPTELSLEPIRADSVILLKSRKLIVHGEFQTDPDVDMGFRSADYSLRIFRKYPDQQLIQVVIYLRQTNSPEVYRTNFRANSLTNEFRVIRLWEQPTDAFLQRPGLWPYAALTNTNDREGVLREVARRIETLTDRAQQSNLASASAVMSGLSLDQAMIQRILRRDIMKESVIYQEWIQEGIAEGKAKGKAEERQTIALNMLRKNMSLDIIAEVTGLPIEQLRQIQAQII
jgi:predicted transposase/invertase (TIGR01784 family)